MPSLVLRPRWLTFQCHAAMMCLAITINLLPVFLTSLAVAYGSHGPLDGEKLGRLGALTFAGLVAGILVTGPLADRFGAKIFAIAGHALIAAGLLGAAFAPNYASLGGALVVLGFGAGILDMILSPIVAALNPTRRSSAMNWLHSFYCVGAVVVILVGTGLLRAGQDWRTACLALLPLPLGVMLLFSAQRFPPLTTEGGRISLRVLLKQRWFQIALVAIFLGGASEQGVAQWLPSFAQISLGYPAWIGGTSLLLFSVAMALGRMAVGSVDLRHDPYLTMAMGCGLTVVLFLGGAGLALPPPLALSAFILAGFTGSCLWPTLLAIAADRQPEGGASMFGALAAAGNAGAVCVPWMVGWIADLHSLAWGLAASAISPALLLGLILLLRLSRKAPTR